MWLNSITNNLQKVKPEFQLLDMKSLVRNERHDRIIKDAVKRSNFLVEKKMLKEKFFSLHKTIIESQKVISESMMEIADVIRKFDALPSIYDEQEVA